MQDFKQRPVPVFKWSTLCNSVPRMPPLSTRFFMVLCLAFAGCAKPSENPPELFGVTDWKREGSGPATHAEGKWWNCKENGGTPLMTEIEFVGSNFYLDSTLFESGCPSTPSGNSDSAILRVESKGAFALGIAGERETFDTEITALRIVPLDSAIAINLNKSKACGFSNWSVGKSKTVSPTSCQSPLTENLMVESFNIFQIVENNFFLGKIGRAGSETDATSPETRPTEFPDAPTWVRL